jgi:hypothetical protein
MQGKFGVVFPILGLTHLLTCHIVSRGAKPSDIFCMEPGDMSELSDLSDEGVEESLVVKKGEIDL